MVETEFHLGGNNERRAEGKDMLITFRKAAVEAKIEGSVVGGREQDDVTEILTARRRCRLSRKTVSWDLREPGICSSTVADRRPPSQSHDVLRKSAHRDRRDDRGQTYNRASKKPRSKLRSSRDWSRLLQYSSSCYSSSALEILWRLRNPVEGWKRVGRRQGM